MSDKTIEPWLEDLFSVARRVTGSQWMDFRAETIEGRDAMRERLGVQNLYYGSATSLAMLALLEKEVSSHADALLTSIKELLDSSAKPLTKGQDNQIIRFCIETFEGVDSVLSPVPLFDEEMERCYRGQSPPGVAKSRQKVRAAKGSAGLRLRVRLEKYLYERRQRLEAQSSTRASVGVPGRIESTTAERNPAMLRIFLCHSSDDKKAVLTLYDRLQADGYRPWLDKKDLLPGQDWESAIRRAVRESNVVVVCLSRGSVTKEGFVQKEIKIALDVSDEKPEDTIFLIPARLEECDIPTRLRKWHWVDLFSDEGYDLLIRALEQRADTLLRLNPKLASAQNTPDPTTDDLAVGIRVGTKMHNSDGFTVQARLTNYTETPAKVDRLELEWWLSDPIRGVRSKKIELNRPLAAKTADYAVMITLSDGEAAQGESEYSDQRKLYAALHGRISVYYYSKNMLRVAKTDPFKFL